MKTHHGCMAAVTVVEDGNLLSVASICNVIRWRRKQVGVSVTLRCVGRARLVGVSQSLPYLSAVASELVDVPDGDAPYPKLSAEIHELHRQCRQLEAKIRDFRKGGSAGGGGGSGGGGTSPVTPVSPEGAFGGTAQAVTVIGGAAGTAAGKSGGARRGAGGSGGGSSETVGESEWGHERLQLRGFDKDLDDIVRDRAAVLLWGTPRATPAGQSRAAAAGGEMAWLLGSKSKEEEDAQLLSFAALSCFGGADRVRALLLTSTAERLTLGRGLLRGHLKLLAAKVALSQLGSGD